MKMRVLVRTLFQTEVRRLVATAMGQVPAHYMLETLRGCVEGMSLVLGETENTIIAQFSSGYQTENGLTIEEHLEENRKLFLAQGYIEGRSVNQLDHDKSDNQLWEE